MIEQAQLHAKAKSIAPSNKQHIHLCSCCQYNTNKLSITYCQFIPSYYMHFYHFLLYLVFALLLQLILRGILSLYQDSHGHLYQSLFLQYSLANIQDNKVDFELQFDLSLLLIPPMLILLIAYRKSSHSLHCELEYLINSMACYSIQVKNIPIGLPVDYVKELKNIFQHYALLDSAYPLVVTNVTLVQKHAKFIGQAYITFESFDMKRRVLLNNTHEFWEPIIFKKGDDNHLTWQDQRLFLQEGPEVMDLIVENFGQPYKLPFRVLSWVLVIALSTFIYLIHFLFLTYNNTTSAYPFLVVFINYFGIDKLVIFIVKKLERRTNKTQQEISIMNKVLYLHFINLGVFGYSFSESLEDFINYQTKIFVYNALIQNLYLLLDPEELYKYILKRRWKGNDQKELNKIYQQVEYSAGVRYGECKCTIWLIFFYKNLIPLSLIIGTIQILIYYAIDRYNLYFRKSVETSMKIQIFFDEILLLGALGQIIQRKTIKEEIDGTDIFLCLLTLIYTLLPLDKINQKMFPQEHLSQDKHDYDMHY